MASSNILKFLNEKQQIITRTKKCFPSQSNTCSRQSPDWFKRKFSLQPQGGYEYKFDDPKICEKFKFESQKHNFNISKNYQSQKDSIFDNNKITFHNKKKGLLSEFINKNQWMKNIIPLMGAQRSPQSRNLNHKQIQKKIQEIKSKKSSYIASKTTSNFYSTKNTLRSNSKDKKENKKNKTLDFIQNPQGHKILQNQEYKSRSSSMNNIFQEKSKIRQIRNEAAQNKILQISKIKILKNSNPSYEKFRTIDSQFVKNRMTQTARQWGFGHGRKSTADQICRLDNMISQHSTRLKLSQNNFKQVPLLNVEDIQNNKFASGQL